MQTKIVHLQDYLAKDQSAHQLKQLIRSDQKSRVLVQGLSGSRDSFLIFSSFLQTKKDFLIIAHDKEDAAYLMNDLEQLAKNTELSFFPDSFKRSLHFEDLDSFQVQQRKLF